MEISDLNNVGMITFLLLKQLDKINSLKWIYFSDSAYDYLAGLEPFKAVNILFDLIKNVDSSCKFIKINYNVDSKKMFFDKLYTKNNLSDKKLQFESLDFEFKQSISYLNAIPQKIKRINDFLFELYSGNFPYISFKDINYIKYYLEYIEIDPQKEIYLKDAKLMINKLENYKIGQELGDLKDIVLNGSFSLILVLRQDILSKIERYNNEVKSFFVI